MAEDTNNPTPATQSTSDATENTDTQTEKTVPYERFKKVNDKLREIEKSLADQKAAADKAQADALAEQGKYKELYEGLAAKLPSLEAKAQTVDAQTAVFQEMLANRLKGIPDHLKPLLEKLSPLDALRYLDENADKFSPNPGSRSNREGEPKGATFNDEEMNMMKTWGISERAMTLAKHMPTSPLDKK